MDSSGDVEEQRSVSGRAEVSKIPKKDDSAMNRYLKLLFCFVGLQLSYIAWGVVQETLMTQQYNMGTFKSSAFCVFGNRFLALFISLAIVFFNRMTSSKPMREAPYYYYIPSSLSNSISSWAQYEALKYISFPSQVLSKSCKIIPVMLVGWLINRKSYPWLDYIEAGMITLGVTMFTLSEKSEKYTSSHNDTMFGVFLLASYLVCDSFTSQWQNKVFNQFGIDQFQMMLGVNIWSMILTGLTLYQSGEFFSSLAFIMSDSTAFMHMVVLSITSATGQLFIFYTIKEFGPVIFTIMMTTRQIFSLFVSCILFGHTLQLTGWISSVFVFAVVFNRLYRGNKD
jgi:adenosine 3'-phospho 5'-phosphosulfate transporter B2